MPPSIDNGDVIRLLTERASHLEDLLVSNLLGFLLTGTLTGFAAIYTLRVEDRTHLILSPRKILVGINFLYLFIGGYYYFMLAQFYATIVTLQRHVVASGADMSELWSVLRVPSLGVMANRTANIAMLAGAPLLPLALSWFSIIAFRALVERNEAGHRIGRLTVLSCLGSQLILGLTFITVPFLAFIHAVGL
jgi:hypothetical protein